MTRRGSIFRLLQSTAGAGRWPLGRIRILDDNLVNRIAAGEVVERPASVVKELVENSLDARAASVSVTLAAGGKRSIRVVDDGDGMDRDDALLAVESHATSKIRAFEDLAALQTLGFRGEALPSIASVARFRLRTSTGGGAGTEIRIRGGRIEAVTDCAMPRGTEVEVRDLFLNVPARRKFLRSDSTELAHAVRLVHHFALAYPAVRFRLEHDGRVLLDAPPAGSRRERIAQVFGTELGRKLVPFEREASAVRVSGFAARPADASPRRDVQHLFVNGRLVQDRLLLHAVAEAYGDTVPRGTWPPVFVFVEIDPASVDVNVHPRKTEVRFVRSGEVHDGVRAAVGSALPARDAVPSLVDLRPAGETGTAAALLRYLDAQAERGAAAPATADGGPPRPLELELREEEGGGRRVAVPLAQYRDSYIIAQDAQGLLLVDQHVAHERVLYEDYLREAESGRVEVQRLLAPLTIEMPPADVLVVEDESEEFRRLGFVVEPFGGDAIRIDGVPSFAAGADLVRLVRGLVGEARATRSAAVKADDLRRRLVTTASCQAAVKVNYPLAREAMQRLLDDLFRTANPTTCPHGRPILFRLTLEEIERAFRRR